MKKAVISAAILSALACGPAFAADKPAASPPGYSIPFDTVLTDIKGAPIKDTTEATQADPNCDKCDDLTLGRAAANALLANYRDEPDLSGPVKMDRGQIALKVINAKGLVLPSGDVSTIKTVIGKFYGPLIVVKTYPLLDPATSQGQ